MNLFKRRNVTPESLQHQERECKLLITNLARAIKGLQAMYAADGEVGHRTITDCRATQSLCTWFEHILSHGLKARKLRLRHSPSFWPLAVKITRKQAIEQIKSLQHAHSEMGHFRAWIRLAVNECSLESYVNVLVQDANLLSQYYDSHAFLHHEELTGALMRLLTGLAHLNISLEVDTINLEYATPLEAMHAPLQKISFPSSSGTYSSRQSKKTRARGEEEADSTDDGDSEGSEMSQDLLTEADFEQLVKETESFVVRSTLRRKFSSATRQEKGITLEPIILTHSADDHTLSEGLEDAAVGRGSETSSVNMQLKSTQTSQDDLPVGRDISHLTLYVTEEPNSPGAREDLGGRLLTPTTPLVASSADGSDGTTPTLSTGGGEVVWEEKTSSDVIQTLAGKGCQIPSLVVSGEEDDLGQHGHKGGRSSSPQGLPPSVHGCAGAEELEPPLDSTVSGSSSECPSPVPITGDPLVGHVPSRNPFDDSDTEDDNMEGGEEGEGRGALGQQTGGSDGGASCNDPDSPKDQVKVRKTPPLLESPFTLEEITSILNNGEDDRLEGLLDEYDIVDALQEDYYCKEPTMEELNEKITALKSELLSPSEAPAQQQLAKEDKLVKLQVALHWMKEVNCSGIMHIMNHQLVQQSRNLVRGISCDLCGGGIHGMIRIWYKCQNCQIACHKGCLKFITRKCVYDKARKAKLILEICPDQGLTHQHFRCALCNIAIGAKKSKSNAARLCHYYGSYYCRSCHHKDTAIIPARVVHNWDFNPYPVSSEAHELLQIMFNRPLIHISSMNPKLYTYIQGLREIEALRREILLMKVFLLCCKSALKKKLLLKLQPHPHFRDSADMFSLQDLVQVHQGTLLSEVQAIHRAFLTHIKTDCQICYSRGGSCEVCHSDQTLFPFDQQVLSCHRCRSLYHKDCIGDSVCALCSRRKERSGAAHAQLPPPTAQLPGNKET